jgi:hypothetical protein
MKTFKQYLNENSNTKTDTSIDKIISAIKNDCQPFLRTVNNPLSLYRGVDVDDGRIFIQKRARLNIRDPQGMSVRDQRAANSYFKRKFGQPFRFSAICTGDIEFASDFGEAYWVFPIGEFSFCWSPIVDDLNQYINLDFVPVSERQSKGKMKLQQAITEIGYSAAMNKTMESLKYQTTDLNRAIKSGNEIMIRCTSWYGVNVYEFTEQYDKNKFKDLLK